MDYLTRLFRVPPPNHRDDALFSYGPSTPNQTSPSSSCYRQVDSRQSLPLHPEDSGVIDLPNAPNPSHGLLYPQPGGFHLPEEIIGDEIFRFEMI